MRTIRLIAAIAAAFTICVIGARPVARQAAERREAAAGWNVVLAGEMQAYPHTLALSPRPRLEFNSDWTRSLTYRDLKRLCETPRSETVPAVGDSARYGAVARASEDKDDSLISPWYRGSRTDSGGGIRMPGVDQSGGPAQSAKTVKEWLSESPLGLGFAFLAIMMLGVILGRLFQEFAKKGPKQLRIKDVGRSLKTGSSGAAFVAAPLVFFGSASMLFDLGPTAGAFYVALQNGFFCLAVIDGIAVGIGKPRERLAERA